MERDPRNVEVMDKLAVPFKEDRIKWKPQSLTKDRKRAMAVAYIDARVVMERLDEVLGPENWQTEYEVLDSGTCVCKLSIRLPSGEWIHKADAGGESDQEDAGDRRKASFSDSLKRAAVQFGVGRHLYALPKQWCDYDDAKKKFVNPPRLPKATGGNPPPRSTEGHDANSASKPAGSAPVKPKQDQKPADAKADTSPRADQVQVDRIDVLLGRLKKDAKWMENALNDRYGKSQPADLTSMEAETVIAGLETACKKAGVQVDEPPANANVESGTKTAVKSAGKTPARRGTF
jgi:hypothetical protein